jgi:hypothetical protein
MKTITATYRLTAEWDIEELDIDWNEVEAYCIKYNTLIVEMKDGSQEDYEPTSDYTETFDFKYPHSVEEETT